MIRSGLELWMTDSSSGTIGCRFETLDVGIHHEGNLSFRDPFLQLSQVGLVDSKELGTTIGEKNLGTFVSQKTSSLSCGISPSYHQHLFESLWYLSLGPQKDAVLDLFWNGIAGLVGPTKYPYCHHHDGGLHHGVLSSMDAKTIVDLFYFVHLVPVPDVKSVVFDVLVYKLQEFFFGAGIKTTDTDGFYLHLAINRIHSLTRMIVFMDSLTGMFSLF
jgi:hypothetical protein